MLRTPIAPAGTARLLEWAADPASATQFSALTATPYLLVDADAADADEAARATIAAWLPALACPVIAIGGASSPVSAACDVQVGDLAAARALIDNIERSPIAAALLVQVLRSIEKMPLTEGLLAESLAYSTLQSGPEFQRWLASHRREPWTNADEGPPLILSREQGQLLIELNRPSRRNPMSVEVRDALIEALQLVLSDPSIERVRLSGRGKCFSTGGDLDEFGSAPDPATAHLVRSLALPGRLLANCAQRVTVQVHGACIGSGIEFPAFAARLVAAPDAWFQLPELRYGLIPGAGGCVSISRRIGRQRTAWLALSGKRLDAVTARAWGLVDALEDRP